MGEASRRPRFRRAANPPPLCLTVRDAHVIRQVHKHRFLRSDHLVALFGGSRQPILRRLHRLYHHGYLDRPRAQIDYYRQGGNPTMVYALGNHGAEFLHTRFGVPRPGGDWTVKNQSAKRLFLEHSLAVADFMVRLERSSRWYPKIRVVESEPMSRLLLPGPQPVQKPFRWSVTLKTKNRSVRLGLIPDQMFGLEFSDRPTANSLQGFFLEVDRATMPVKRANLYQTSIHRKLLAYYETWRQQPLAISRFRVIFVTSSPERLQSLLTANREFNQGKGSGLFLFTDFLTLSQHPDLLTLPFRSGNSDNPVQLIEN